MNVKRCVYKNCGNTSAFSPKITFFSFPLKDMDKCQHWAEMAGIDDPVLKNKYLCENHFSTVYISRTPRRTVLLPNAVPFRYADNANTDENYDEDYNSDKNASREEIILDNLDEEHEIIYSDTIEVVHHKEDAGDVENVETFEDPVIEDELNVKPKVKATAMKAPPKSYDQPIEERAQKLDTIANKRTSISSGEFVNNITKRQKFNASAEIVNGFVSNLVKNEALKTVAQQEADDGDDAKIEEQGEEALDNTINNPDITTFIYKGEEYIQMPKRIYLQQRAKLDADAKRYKNIVESIKILANSTD